MTTPLTDAQLARYGGPVAREDIDLTWDGDDVIVSWRYEGGPWIVVEANVEYEAADRSVGMDGGWIVNCEWLPLKVEQQVEAEAADRARDRYDDSLDCERDAYPVRSSRLRGPAADPDGVNSWRGGL